MICKASICVVALALAVLVGGCGEAPGEGEGEAPGEFQMGSPED